MSSGKVKCTCGWSWNKSDSSKKDMYICHECGRDNSNNMKNGGWLDNYNDSETSVPEGYVGEGYSSIGRDYSPAWGGQFEDGGKLFPSAQLGTATRADSLAVLNSQLALNKFYDKEVKAGRLKKDKFDYKNFSLYYPKANDVAQLNKENLKFYRDAINQRAKIKAGTWDDNYKKHFNFSRNQISNLEYKGLGQTKASNKNKAYYRDRITPMQNLAAPMALIDSRIAPQGEIDYKQTEASYPGGSVSVYDYDPLAVTPFNMLTDAQKKLRVKKYGTSGVPKSYIKGTKDKLDKDPIPNKNKKLDADPKIRLQPDLPMVEAINLPPMQQLQSINPPAISEVVREPKSYNVRAQRYHMQGPSDYYNYNKESVDYETAMKVKAASDYYNKTILKRYGPQNEYRTPKSAEKAAERLKQLRSEFEMTPNYQMGGYVYPVNYVPEAQMGASIPGAVGFSYARTNDPAPSNGPYAKKTKASAQKGKTIPKLDISQLDLTIPKSTGYAWADEKMKKNADFAKKLKTTITNIDNRGIADIKKQYKVDDATAKKLYTNKKYANKEQAEIRQYTPQSTLSKTWEVLTNPMTAIGYKVRNQDLPDNFSKGERSILDMPTDIINPAAWLNYGAKGVSDFSDVPGQLLKGDFEGAGESTFSGTVNLLGALPLGQEIRPFASSALKTLPKVKTFAKGAASDIKFTADQIGQLNNQIKTTRPYVDQSLVHINDVRRIPEHMSTVATRDDLIHQLNYLQDDLRSTYESAAAYRASPNKISEAVNNWRNSAITKIGSENFSINHPSINDPAYLQSLYNNLLDNLPNAKEIEKFGVSAIKSAKVKQIFDPSTDIEKIKTFAKSIGKKSDDVSEITIAPNEQETINAVRELGKYRNMIHSDMNAALSHPKTLQNLNQLILKLDDDVVQSIVGVPKAELLNRYKNMVPLDIREGVKDIISNPISTNELRSVPASYTTIDPAIEKLNSGYGDSSLFSKLGKRYYEMDSPYNIEEMASLPKSMINFARTDKYLKAKYDWDNSFLGYEDDVFTSGNTTGQLRDALKTVEAAPKGQNFVGSGSLSTDSFPLTLDSGMFMMKKGIVEPKFSGELRPLNPMGTTNQLPNLSLKEINFKIQELEKLSGKKIPRAKIVNGEYKVPEIYFTKLKKGGVIKDDLGQWAHPGEITEIGSNQITMQGVPYPVLGISDTGDMQMMYPEEEYEFDGEKVIEYPMAKNGLRQEQKGLVNLDQLTNFTNYNTKQPGGWLDKY